MINIRTGGLFDGQFTRLFKDLYVKTSSKPLVNVLPYPKEMKPYLDVLYGAFKREYTFSDCKFDIKKINIPNVYDPRCLCAFSGGKDSVANALLLRDNGFEPILFFVKGINRSYPNEYETAVDLASEIGMEIVVKTVSVSGKCDFVENPTKDQFILAMMVDYGSKLGIVNYSFGCCRGDKLKTTSKEYMLSDCIEMFSSVEKFYQKFIDGFNIANFLRCETESFCIIRKHDMSLLNRCYSCMTPLRYKKNIIQANLKNYGIELLSNRCGSCYKCCQEALILHTIGVMNYNDDFISHCNDIIDAMQNKFDNTSEVKDNTPWIDYTIIREYFGGN